MPPNLHLTAQPPLTLGHLDQAEDLNLAILRGFERERGGPAWRQSHLENGRYENSYILRQTIPEIEPLHSALEDAARHILGIAQIKTGFWFNAMQPGDRTERHNHAESDEWLSCVYYLLTPDDCGDLLVHHAGGCERVHPRAGQAVFFSPTLAHQVETNRSGLMRLSVAFNFGLDKDE